MFSTREFLKTLISATSRAGLTSFPALRLWDLGVLTCFFPNLETLEPWHGPERSKASEGSENSHRTHPTHTYILPNLVATGKLEIIMKSKLNKETKLKRNQTYIGKLKIEQIYNLNRLNIRPIISHNVRSCKVSLRLLSESSLFFLYHSYIIYKRQNLQNLKCLLPSLHSLAHSCSRKLMQSLQSTGTPNFYPIFTLSTPNTNLKCSPFFARLWRTLDHVCQLFVSILWLMGLWVWWPYFFWVKDETAFWFVCLHKS